MSKKICKVVICEKIYQKREEMTDEYTNSK